MGYTKIYRGGFVVARKIKAAFIKSDSLEQIKSCISAKKSFLLEAGAGSGKTKTLIDTLKYILNEYGHSLNKSNQLIAAITFTNTAKDEIIERTNFSATVHVSTIHEFLWQVIKNYQNEIKKCLIYNNQKSPNPILNLENSLKLANVTYSQYGRKYEVGRITHDDVIELSYRLFGKYPKLGTIVANKYPFILVDEYQDTEERTVSLLIEYIAKINRKIFTLGFFGDSMQQIYNQGIGKIKNPFITEITKTENYRCPKKIINILNKIRPELLQVAAGNNAVGSVAFFTCNNDIGNKDNFTKCTDYLKKLNWAFRGNEDKVLFLTHMGIASKSGYTNLLRVYDQISFGRDKLFNKEEPYSNFIQNKIENLVCAYLDRHYGRFIDLLDIDDFKIRSVSDKTKIRSLMDELIKKRESESIRDVLNFVYNENLLSKPPAIVEFESKLDDLNKDTNKAFYNSLMSVQYSEFIPLYNFVEKRTPFSTKHGVKGAEFENVLVVIDDNSWRQYNFNDVFAQNNTNVERYNRTRNLLYVCCSRTKSKLSVLCLSLLNDKAVNTVHDWFGNNNVFDVSKLS